MKRKDASELSGFGRVITGSVHDCDKDQLERSLKFYDPFLYLKWNTDKRDGRGCWEVRRAPESGTYILHGQLNGKNIYSYERRESDIIHHVLDVPFLDYSLLGKLKSMDMWKHKDINTYFENQADEFEATTRRKAREEMKYDLKQFKQEWKEMTSLLQHGADPAQFIKGIKG